MYKALAKKFVGIPDEQLDEESSKLRIASEFKLTHPLTLSADQLHELIPIEINMMEFQKRIRNKQKEIVHRIDIEKLPRDRPPGFFGQAALFEAMREMNYDFSFIVGGEYSEEFSFFEVLALSQYAVDLLGYEKDHFSVDAYFEPWDEGIRSDRRTEIWRDRILRIYRFRINKNLDFFRNSDLRTITDKTLKTTVKRGYTIPKIVKWLDCSNSHAARLYQFTKSLTLINRIYSLNLIRAGFVRSIEERQKVPSPKEIEFWFHGKKVGEETPVFLAGSLHRKQNFEGKGMDLEAAGMNFSAYDARQFRWILPASTSEVRTIDDLHQLFGFSFMTTSDSKVKLSERDIFYLGISRIASYNQVTHETLSKMLDLEQAEIEEGFRNIFRKKLIKTTFKASYPGLENFIVIESRGSTKKLVPFIGEVYQNAPSTSLRISKEFDYAFHWHHLPEYLTKDFIDKVQQIAIDRDVESSIYRITKFRPYHLSSVMNLLNE